MQSMKKINSFLRSAKLSYHNALLSALCYIFFNINGFCLGSRLTCPKSQPLQRFRDFQSLLHIHYPCFNLKRKEPVFFPFLIDDSKRLKFSIWFIVIGRSNEKNFYQDLDNFFYSLSWRKYDLDLKSQQCLLKMSNLPWPVQRLFKESYDRLRVLTPTTTAATPTINSKELMKPVS